MPTKMSCHECHVITYFQADGGLQGKADLLRPNARSKAVIGVVCQLNSLFRRSVKSIKSKTEETVTLSRKQEKLAPV